MDEQELISVLSALLDEKLDGKLLEIKMDMQDLKTAMQDLKADMTEIKNGVIRIDNTQDNVIIPLLEETLSKCSPTYKNPGTDVKTFAPDQVI